MSEEALLTFRDRFELPLTDEQVRAAQYYKPPEDSPEMRYLRPRRAALGGGSLAARRRRAEPLKVPGLDAFKSQLEGSGEREISTTMAFVRVLAALLRDKALARHIVPVVPDESRTFGMEGMFRQVGIYSPRGSALPAPGRRAADVLQGGSARPDPRPGHHRGRLDLRLQRRRHLLQHPRRADGPVLHLLLDVRLPKGGRSRVGGG